MVTTLFSKAQLIMFLCFFFSNVQRKKEIYGKRKKKKRKKERKKERKIERKKEKKKEKKLKK